MSGCDGCGLRSGWGTVPGTGPVAGCDCGGCSTACGGACARPGTARCCRGIATSTPRPVWNRPGLRELSWRVGTHPQFLASMVAGLSRADRKGLGALRSRASDDLSLALLDGWAAVADVLTFYTERIAQEGYLRTARERRSLVELAALVGHRPRPGLAASSYLAYTIAAGSVVEVPAGSRAQSVPDPGDLPATFETADPLLARADANLLPVRLRRPQVLTTGTFGSREHVVVAGAQPQVLAGDNLLVRFPGTSAWSLLEVTSVEVRADRTTLGFLTVHSDGIGSDVVGWRRPTERRRPAKDSTRLGRLVDALRLPPSVPPPSERELRRDPRRLLAGGSDGVVELLGIAVPAVARTLRPALSETTAADPDPARIWRWTARTHLYGHQAPLLARYADGAVNGFTDPLITKLLVDTPPVILAVAGTETIDPPHYNPSTYVLLDEVTDVVAPGTEVAFVNEDLDEKVEFRIVEKVTTVSVSALGTQGRVTRLKLDQAWPSAPAAGGELVLRTVLRNTTVLAAPAALEAADDPVVEDVEGDEIELEGLFRDLEPGRWIVVSGERTDAAIREEQGRGRSLRGAPLDEAGDGGEGTGVHGAELAMIASVTHRQSFLPTSDRDDGEGEPEAPQVLPGDAVHTFVTLAAPLAFTYRRPTVVVHGNVVRATHGESTHEVLGSGDATRAWASYALKQTPLTHLPAVTADGALSTLEVYVDGLRWRELPDFAVAGPSDRAYVVTHREDGAVHVVFGDGVRGMRPPTGSENIVARYRVGQGRYANLPEHRITTATSRPLGVMEVTNPVPATGGADPDRDEALRLRTPLGVRALDRLVSVSDYADLATGFAGVGSAVADEITDGRRRLVHVTVAGIDDEPMSEDSDLLRALRRTLVDLGDPQYDVQVASRRLRMVVIAANVRISPDRRWDDVEPALRRSILARFGPSARTVGSGLPASAVLATMAAVPGVDFVDLDVFDFLDEASLVTDDPAAGLGLREQVPGRRAATDPDERGGIRPGELVVISPRAPDTLLLAQLTGVS